MRTVFKAAAIVVGIASAILFVLARVDRASSLMMSDAIQTKAEVLRRIPINSPIGVAKEIMNSNGFKCGTMRNTGYADFANPLNKQVDRGPANILYCDSGERSSGLMLVSKRWQVSFEDDDGRVSYVAVGVGLTGP
jgi:hypothetical protein